MGTKTIRVPDEDEKLIDDYLAMTGTTFSRFALSAITEKIEDEIDLASYRKAIEKNKDKPTYTLDEAKKLLGLS